MGDTPTGSTSVNWSALITKECDRLVEKPDTTGTGIPSSNWTNWKVRIGLIFDVHDLQDVLVTPLPPNPSASNRLKDKMVKFTLVHAVATPELIQSCKTGYDMWQKLLSRFEAKSLTRENLLRDLLSSVKFRIGTSLNCHLDLLLRIREQLKAIGAGEDLTDQFMTKRLIQSMPYTEFATVIDALDEKDIDWSDVSIKLASKHIRLLQSINAAKSSPPAAAFVSTGALPLPPCEHCGLSGHPSRWCYSKFPREHVDALRKKEKAARAARPNPGGSSLVAQADIEPTSEPIPEPTNQGFGFTSISQVDHAAPLAKCDGWIIDSGASHHLCHDRSRFTNYQPLHNPIPIRLGSGQVLYGVGKGDILVTFMMNDTVTSTMVHEVLWVPGSCFNLLSTGWYDVRGCDIRMKNGLCTVRSPQGDPIIFGTMDTTTTLYRLREVPPSASIGQINSTDAGSSSLSDMMIMVPAVTAELLHARLGHLNDADMKKLLTMADGVSYTGKLSSVCESCIMAKQQRASIPKSGTTETTSVLQVVTSDIAGPFPVPGLHGERYAAFFIDVHSSMVWCRLLKGKDQVLDAFVDWKTFVENQTNIKIKAFRSDGAMEYQSAAFSKCLADSGIERQTSAPYTQAQNGKAERFVRTITEYSRAMLFFSGLPASFWSVAFEHACYLRNRLPTQALASKTPYEVWYRRKPDLSHVRVFGCTSYAHIPDATRKKLDPKSRKCIYLGVPSGVKGFRLYDPERRCIFMSAHVKFDESARAFDKSDPEALDDLFDLESVLATEHLVPASVSGAITDPLDGPSVAGNSDETEFLVSVPMLDPAEVQVSVDPFNSDAPRRSARDRRPPQLFIHDGKLGDQLGISTSTGGGGAQDSGISGATGVSGVVALSQLQSSAGVNAKTHSSRPVLGSDASLAGVSMTDGSQQLGLNFEDPVASVMINGCAVNHQAVPTVGIHLDGPQSLLPTDTEDYEKLFSAGFALAGSEVSLHNEPLTYLDAISRPDGQAWLDSMREEFKSLVEAGTFELVVLPEGANLVTCRWVFKLKLNADGTVDRHKSRLVARGFTQRYGIDYDLTFAPVVKLQSIRMLLSIAAALDWEIHQMDVTTAFLNGDLDHVIYMAQPEGFVDQKNKDKVWLLKKSLYGLKQAGRSWNLKIHKVLTKLGFSRLECDHCVYHFSNGSTVIWLCLYVDDVLLFSNNTLPLTACKRRLCAEFKMKDLGEAKFVLGIQIFRDRPNRKISINQASYIRSILAKFRQESAKPTMTPLDAGVQLSKIDLPAAFSAEQRAMTKVPYLQAVGALMFLMLGTRPDIAFSITKLSQFSHNPGFVHWKAVQRVLRYLGATINLSITYSGTTHLSQPSLSLVGYCDADWGSARDDRKSISGYVICANNGAVFWQARKQPTVAQSSVEAEYVAMSQATKDVLWWSYLIGGLGLSFPSPFNIYSDSQGAIALVEQPSMHDKAKHIDIRHHFMRELHERRIVDYLFIGTDAMPADLLTKALPREAHWRLLGKFGLAVDSSAGVDVNKSVVNQRSY